MFRSNCWRAERRVVFVQVDYLGENEKRRCEKFSLSERKFLIVCSFMKAYFIAFTPVIFSVFFSKSCFVQLSNLEKLRLVVLPSEAIYTIGVILRLFLPFCLVLSFFSNCSILQIFIALGYYLVKISSSSTFGHLSIGLALTLGCFCWRNSCKFEQIFSSCLFLIFFAFLSSFVVFMSFFN